MALDFSAEVALVMEKARIAASNRITHLAKRGRYDSDAEKVLKFVHAGELLTDYLLKKGLLEHPASEWFLRIRGLALQPLGKVLGQIEAFGRWYDVDDPMIPNDGVQREPVTHEDGKVSVWVNAIERFPTRSALLKYAGFDPENDKPVKGKVLAYNATLKTMCWRLWKFGMLIPKGSYYDLYARQKDRLMLRYQHSGIKVLPTPAGRFCAACLEEKSVPATTWTCPDCGEKLAKKLEPEGVIWLGHVDNQAARWALKMFLNHLWEVWRKNAGLAVRPSYAQEYLGHSHHIDPYEMCDLDTPRDVELKLPIGVEKFVEKFSQGASASPTGLLTPLSHHER